MAFGANGVVRKQGKAEGSVRAKVTTGRSSFSFMFCISLVRTPLTETAVELSSLFPWNPHLVFFSMASYSCLPFLPSASNWIRRKRLRSETILSIYNIVTQKKIKGILSVV